MIREKILFVGTETLSSFLLSPPITGEAETKKKYNSVSNVSVYVCVHNVSVPGYVPLMFRNK